MEVMLELMSKDEKMIPTKKNGEYMFCTTGIYARCGIRVRVAAANAGQVRTMNE